MRRIIREEYERHLIEEGMKEKAMEFIAKNIDGDKIKDFLIGLAKKAGQDAFDAAMDSIGYIPKPDEDKESTNESRRRFKSRIMSEYGRTSYGNTPMTGFKPAEMMGVADVINEIFYIMDELEDGSVRLIDPHEYDELLGWMEDLASDGDVEIENYLARLVGNKQGQYVRIALR